MKLRSKYLLSALIFISGCFDTCQNNREVILEEWDNGSPKKVRVLFPSPDELETNFFKNGNKESEGFMVDDKKERDWIYYYKNGEIKETAAYMEGIPYGEIRTYYEDGTLKAIKNYDNNGLKVGKWEEYYQNGKKIYSGNFYVGKKTGEWYYFLKTGNKEKIEIFDQDGRMENAKYFDKVNLDGKEIFYPNGVRKVLDLTEGDTIFHKDYYENGKIVHEGKLINLFEVGKWTFRYKSGIKKAEGAFIEDIMDEKYKDVITDEKWLKKLPLTKAFRGIKTGIWTYWNDNGQKVFIIEYSIKNGKLVEKVKLRRY